MKENATYEICKPERKSDPQKAKLYSLQNT